MYDLIIRAGLRALQARDAAVKSLLRNEVARSYDEYAADPKSGIPGHKIMSRLKAAHAKRRTKSKR